jgi:dipeptidyl aminopeptidase/acylaminoacyl peptidase
MIALGKYQIGEAGEGIKQAWWTNKNRLLVQTSTRYAGRVDISGKPDIYRTGSYYALNADGKKKRKLFGTDLGDTHQFDVIAVLPDDNKQVVIQRKTLDRSARAATGAPEAFLKDVYDRRVRAEIESHIQQGPRNVVGSPLQNGDLHADHAGAIRVATGYSADGSRKSLFFRDKRDKKGADWIDLSSHVISSNDDGFAFLGFDSGNRKFFVLTDVGGDTTGLGQFTPDSRELSVIYRHPRLDLRAEDIIWNGAGDKIIGVTLRGGYPENHYLDESDAGVKLHQYLDALFPGQLVQTVSKARDNSKFVVKVSADRNPGDYYLFDQKTKKLSILYRVRSEISRKKLAPMNAFKLRSRDGLMIPGYVTTPLKGQPPYAMVVIPALDLKGKGVGWGFDPLAQYLTQQGYAVLNVNSRGSRGFGASYRQAGYGNLGDDMLEDIAAAVKWSIQQKIANEDNICILGIGLGGYSALNAAAVAPSQYKCAIGYSGMYDLPRMLGTLEKAKLPAETAYLQSLLKNTPQDLDMFSPANKADKITAEVLLLHGNQIPLMTIDQSKAMNEALKRSGSEPRWHKSKDESDIFYGQQSRIESYQIITKFLGENLK